MKSTKQKVIPIHRMDAHTPLGIQFSYQKMTNEYNEIVMISQKNIAHRDDYYIICKFDALELVNRKHPK